MRSLRSVLSAMTLMPTKRATAQRSARAAAAPRLAESFISVGLLQIDEDDVGEQEDADHRGEEDRVAQVDDAADDRVEMRQEAERGDGRDDALRRPGLQHPEDDRRAADGEGEAGRCRQDEGDDLVL